MKDLVLQRQRGDRLDAESFGFRDAPLGSAQVNDLDIVAVSVQRAENRLFSAHTHGAAGVIENGFRLPRTNDEARARSLEDGTFW